MGSGTGQKGVWGWLATLVTIWLLFKGTVGSTLLPLSADRAQAVDRWIRSSLFLIEGYLAKCTPFDIVFHKQL